MKCVVIVLGLLLATSVHAEMRLAAVPAGAQVRIGADGQPGPAKQAWVIQVLGEEGGVVRFHDRAGGAKIEAFVAVDQLTPTLAEPAVLVKGKEGVLARLPVGSRVEDKGEGRVRFENDEVWIAGEGRALRFTPIFTRRFDQPIHTDNVHILAAGSDLLLSPGGKAFAGTRQDLGVERLGRGRRGHVLVRFRDNGVELVGWVKAKAVRRGQRGELNPVGGMISNDDPPAVSVYAGSTLHVAAGGPPVGKTEYDLAGLERVGGKDGWSAWKIDCLVAGPRIFWVRDRL